MGADHECALQTRERQHAAVELRAAVEELTDRLDRAGPDLATPLTAFLEELMADTEAKLAVVDESPASRA